MKFEFEKRIGRNKFTFFDEAASHTEFFQKVDFYSGLPEVGPNGEEDLRIKFRKTAGGHTYYSIICDSAKKEFKFGQFKADSTNLFPKAWEPVFEYQGDDSDAGSSGGNGGGGGLGDNSTPSGDAQPAAEGSGGLGDVAGKAAGSPMAKSETPVDSALKSKSHSVLDEFKKLPKKAA